MYPRDGETCLKNKFTSNIIFTMNEKPENRYYVYGLKDPRNNKYFYIGKGCGKRAYTHLVGRGKNEAKQAVIDAIQLLGYEVIVDIISNNLNQNDAFKLERKLIKKYDNLTNISQGQLTNLERVRILTIESFAILKPICQVIKEGKSIKMAIQIRDELKEVLALTEVLNGSPNEI